MIFSSGYFDRLPTLPCLRATATARVSGPTQPRNILAIRKDGQVAPMPGPAHRFGPGEHVILPGIERDVQRFLRF